MKRIVVFLLAMALLLSLFACGGDQERAITCEEIIAVYEAAGYQVTHRACDENDQGRIYLIQATHPNGDYVNFDFFDTEEHAEEYADVLEANLLTWLFSVILGDPTWPNVECYGKIVIAYDADYLYEPFEELLS